MTADVVILLLCFRPLFIDSAFVSLNHCREQALPKVSSGEAKTLKKFEETP